MATLDRTAPAFVAMAHRIVWCTVATVSPDGRPRTRVLHPIWDWDGTSLRGWIATAPQSPKARDLAVHPHVSLTYWDATHDTGTADCEAAWRNDAASKESLWSRFCEAPQPVGYDPALIPGWDSPASEAFGVLELTPTRLRVFPGTMLLQGVGEVLTWRR